MFHLFIAEFVKSHSGVIKSKTIEKYSQTISLKCILIDLNYVQVSFFPHKAYE